MIHAPCLFMAANHQQIDPRHRYGHNLHLYYEIWFQSSSTEPFFYWCVFIHRRITNSSDAMRFFSS